MKVVNNLKKLIVSIVILSAMLAACSPTPSEVENTPVIDEETKKVKSEEVEEETEEEVEEEVEEEEEEEIDESERGYYRDNDEKFSFNKDIYYVHIKEINNNVLNNRPNGGISSQDTHYYKEDDVLYFFYDSFLPEENTNMLVVEEQLNNDYLLRYKLHIEESNKTEFTLSSIDNEFVKNNNRLYLGSKIVINGVAGSESIVFSVNGNSHEVKSGEEKEIEIESGELKSSIVVSNYGLLSSSEDMTRQVIPGAERIPRTGDENYEDYLEYLDSRYFIEGKEFEDFLEGVDLDMEEIDTDNEEGEIESEND